MTVGYVEKLKAEMEERLGCKIEIVEDRDSSYPCKMNSFQEQLPMVRGLTRPRPFA